MTLTGLLLSTRKKALHKNHVWDLVEAAGKQVITSRWINTVKADGRKKARLVARGFQQTLNVEQSEVYSPVVDTTNLRILFSLAAQNNLIIITFDVKTAFLNGTLRTSIHGGPKRLQPSRQSMPSEKGPVRSETGASMLVQEAYLISQ